MRPRELIFAAVAMTAFAQQGGVVFHATSNLVIVDVSVRDRSGKEITDLKKKEDFTILEDGKPQKLSVFEFQRLGTEVLPEIDTSASNKAAPERKKVFASSTAGQIRYQDRRLVVMFFDLSSMAIPEQMRARDAALKFLSKQMTSSDLVAIMTFSSQLRVVQDFTADRDLLVAGIRSIRVGEASELAVAGDTAATDTGEDTAAAFTADETEFNIFNTDRKLSALESAAKMLAGLPERKALVYFSSGVGKTGVENDSQLRSTINAAVRANVSFFPVDARGLVASAPAGDASQSSPRGSGIFTGAAQNQIREDFNNQQETLVTLAADTGGKALLDNNDLSVGIQRAQNDIHSYYILGFYSTNPAQDGRYRRVKVKLAGNLEAKLDYRGGYFAPKQFGDYTSDDKELQLEQALALGDPVTDLPLALQVDHFRLARERYFVPVSVKIPSSVISLARKGANQVTEFDFIGQVRDAKGRLVANVRDGIRVKLNEANASQLARRQFQYDTGFTLPSGDYRIKFLARENQTGKMGTFETGFKVPDLYAPSGYLRLSSVIWSSQREAVAAAVGTASNDRRTSDANPLIEGGTKLISSVTNVFRKDQNLYVYLEAYDPGRDPATRKPGLTATLSLFRGNVKAFETEPMEFTGTAARRPAALPIRMEVPLEKLSPGEYICQVSVVDPLGKKFGFARARVVLLDRQPAPAAEPAPAASAGLH
jgi:VWFA-related protein